MQQQAPEGRLQRASEALLSLTPAPGRGKRQVQDETELVAAAQAILKVHEVVGLLNYSYECQEKRHQKYVGRGRDGPERLQQEIVTIRYRMTAISRQEEAIAALQKNLRLARFVTDALVEQLSLEQAVLTYRDEWLIERGFHPLKGVPLSLGPLFVKRDNQVVGLTNLLSLEPVMNLQDMSHQTDEIPEHQHGKSQVVEGGKGLWQAFVVTCQAPETSHPTEATLNYPAPRQEHEASLGLGQLDHQQFHSLTLGSLCGFIAGISLIHKSDFHRLFCYILHLASEFFHLRSILLIGGCHIQGQQMPQGIHRNVRFAALLRLCSS